ncbi:MAG: GNAT family N-acetyltransferase [bacterium]
MIGRERKSRLHLREATDDEVPILLAVLQAAFEQYRGRLDPPSGVHSETLETIRQKLKTGSAVLALVDDEVAGCVFYQQQASHMYLGRLSVLPKYRRQGVGQALIDCHAEGYTDRVMVTGTIRRRDARGRMRRGFGGRPTFP